MVNISKKDVHTYIQELDLCYKIEKNYYIFSIITVLKL